MINGTYSKTEFISASAHLYTVITNVNIEDESDISEAEDIEEESVEDNQFDLDSLIHIICSDKRKTTVLLPCKHMHFCYHCAEKIFFSQQPDCPLCRHPIAKLFRANV